MNEIGVTHGTSRTVGKVADAVQRHRTAIRLVAGALAAVSAIINFACTFVLEIDYSGMGDVTGSLPTGTAWDVGLRVTDGGSYGMVLSVVAPAVLAATLLLARWWEPVLVAVCVYAVHWIGLVPTYQRFELAVEVPLITWQVRGLMSLALALILGCSLMVTSRHRQGGTSVRTEVLLVAAGIVSWSLTWHRPHVEFESEGLRTENAGLLSGFPFDLDRFADHPFDHLLAYLPVVLVVGACASMFVTAGRGRPHLRVAVWCGLAAGMMADVVQRIPVWYDPNPYGVVLASGPPGSTLDGVWSPAVVPFFLLLVSAVAFVTAAWAAWSSIEAAAGPDPLQTPIEVFDLDTSPLWGDRT